MAPTPDKHWKEQSPDACMDVLEAGDQALVAPHRISRRLAARLLRLPLKGGVIGPSMAPMPSRFLVAPPSVTGSMISGGGASCRGSDSEPRRPGT